jgi:mono/diheme cytochrome c family protein
MNRMIAIAAVMVASGATAHAQDPSQRGRALLSEFCAGCHAIGRGGDSPRTGAPPFRTLGRSFDLDRFSRQLVAGVMSGHPDMPEFKFSEEEANAVAAYLRSIQD